MKQESEEQSYAARERLWDDQWPTPPLDEQGGQAPAESLLTDEEDELRGFPEVVGTENVMTAVRDAEPFTPAVDPPVLPGGEEGIHVATGFGLSSEEEAAEQGRPRGDEDVRDQAILALRQDSLTSQYPLHVQVNDGVIYLRGNVGSVEDADHAMAMLGDLPGVVDVIDETSVDPALG